MNQVDARPDDRDLLISRLIDGEATVREWRDFGVSVKADAAMWGEVVEAQRSKALLAGALAELTDAADRVELPGDTEMRRLRAAGALERLDGSEVVGRIGPARAASWKGWAGWAAAAAVVLAWSGGVLPVNSGGGNFGPMPGHEAGLFRINTPEDALKAYVNVGQKQGMVAGEMPSHVLLDARPAADGEGFEVVYLRQFVERTRVKSLFRAGQDDAGNAVPVPVSVVRPKGSF
ncbi:MAG: hypothetical protein JNM07_04405 [Phycisphaerae bacterium]|nr:hypothetical protein [Phycisphaerae bacterium]